MTEDKYKQKLERKRRYRKTYKDYFNQQKKEYYAANKESILARQHEYYAANKDRIAERQREYYAANKDRILERQRERYNTHKERYREQRAANRDKLAERLRDYRANNPDRVAAQQHKYYTQNHDRILERKRKAYADRKGNGNHLYRAWQNMKQRTTNPNHISAKHYYERGIRVCDEWIRDFHAFEAWALSHGYADDLSLDRIDNDGDYSPENCRWVDAKTQARNRRTTRYITFGGETRCIAEWAEITGINLGTIKSRIYLGWSAEDVLTTPVKKKGGKNNGT